MKLAELMLMQTDRDLGRIDYLRRIDPYFNAVWCVLEFWRKNRLDEILKSR